MPAEKGIKKRRTLISPDFFEEMLKQKPGDWTDDPDVRTGVDWLLSFVPKEEWERRRFNALSDFIAAATGRPADPSGKGRFFNDRDRFAWYLFLGQAYLDYPTVYEAVYGSRVIPVLDAIGRNLELLKGVEGVEARVRRMVGPEKGQPNACMFELLVAAAYRRQGAQVRFLEERPGVSKTHDMDVLLNGTNWAVECKRLEGGEYVETERARAQALWVPVSRHLHALGRSVLCNVDFLVELSEVPTKYLAQRTAEWLRLGGESAHSWSDSISSGRIERLNLQPLQTVLQSSDIRMHSTQMKELLTGRYKRNANIMTSLHIQYADNPIFIKSCDGGCVCDWSSSSETAIDKRARDVFRRVVDGCRQLPDGRPGIVHIGFETVDDDEVEKRRHAKILRSLKGFDPKGKELEYVYVNWFSPESPPNNLFAFDETSHYQAIHHKQNRPLLNGFLVLPSDTVSRKGGYWQK